MSNVVSKAKITTRKITTRYETKLDEQVLADRDKFALRLGCSPSQFENVVKSIVSGGMCAAIAGLGKAAITAKVVFLGISLPFTWSVALPTVALAAIIGFVLGGSADMAFRKIREKLSTTGEYKKFFDISEAKLAKIIADIVFRPLAALAIPLRNKGKREEYILKQLKDWGYDENWSRWFLSGLEGKSQNEILKPAIDLLSVKRFGEMEVDKCVSKKKAMENGIGIMEEAARARLGLGQKRLQKIRQKLRDKFSE